MAKIHTLEWTPAILPHPLLVLAINANWNGLAAGPARRCSATWPTTICSAASPGRRPTITRAPYSLTEEFAAVYRMHSLMPDDFEIRSVEDDALLGSFELPEVSGRAGRKVIEKFDCADLFYSLGHRASRRDAAAQLSRSTCRTCTSDTTASASTSAAVDILRDRERGVPRYNQFRRLFHKPPVKTFEELRDNPEWAEEIKQVYGGDIERVDLLVGLHAPSRCPRAWASATPRSASSS